MPDVYQDAHVIDYRLAQIHRLRKRVTDLLGEKKAVAADDAAIGAAGPPDAAPSEDRQSDERFVNPSLLTFREPKILARCRNPYEMARSERFELPTLRFEV